MILIPVNVAKYHVRISIGNKSYDFIHFLNDMGWLRDIKDMVEKSQGIWPEALDMAASFSPLWTSWIHNTLFNGKNGFDLGECGRVNLNKRLRKIFDRFGGDSPSDDTRHLTPQDIAAALIYLEQAFEKGRSVDDALDLTNMRVWLISDHVRERLELILPQVKDHILFFLKKGRDMEKIPLNFSAKTSRVLDPLFHGELCQINEDTNPLSELSLKRKLTLLGPRGMRKTYGALERRGVHASHYGRICLTETPESESIGLNLYLALAAKVENGTLKAPYVKTLQGSGTPKTVWLTAEEELNETIAPAACREYEENDGKLLARKNGGKVTPAGLDNITLFDKYRAQFLGMGANLVPFIQHNDNNRVMMGAKNMKQAVPLLLSEAPLVKTGREELVARLSGHAVYSISAGVVESVTEGRITIKNEDQEIETYWLKKIRPTFHNTIRMHRPVVKKGDLVKAGQILADGACTRNGELALGVNLLVAYLPYYGLNFEDGIVISDRLVKEDTFTSLHLRSFIFDVYGDERMSLENMSQGDMNQEMLGFFIHKGILCREGQEIHKGDRLFGKYRLAGRQPVSEWFKSPVNGTVIDILPKQWVKPNATSPAQIRYSRICWILEERKINVGDKLMGRHGNKGVVSRIIPQEEMPHLEDGTPVDIILNPHGVISRMNLGQILETHLGWILKRGGEKYQELATVVPFERIEERELRKIFKELEKTGIDENGKAVLIDGRSGRKIENPVVVGYQYFMKLNHLVEDKINMRESGRYTLLTKQPPKGKKLTGGQRVGQMEVWALEAHLAGHLLQEFLTVKSDLLKVRKRDITRLYLGQDSPLGDTTPFHETLRVTAMLLRGICIDVTFRDKKGKSIPLGSDDLKNLASIQLSLADANTIKAWGVGRVVANPERPSVKKGRIKWVKQGLIDPAVFKDTRRDMAFIKLAEPVIHPLYLRDFLRKIAGIKHRKE
ncbi:MAG: hypothetical protein J7M32_01515, partial [Deltaproteobacteria bacterium]|nr:hypothetical protein [Deltaproteobacteria bacterium]